MSVLQIHGATVELSTERERIAFDKFHVAQYLGNAVNKVRIEEHKALMATGSDLLKGTR
ncbi:MAG: transposase, partial [Endozoicomonas sp.]|uniref:transposase n=1 Tax=Endozoicomonas sp. TaxID=1892382 RepID=UPI003D9BDC09